ncbi:MAG: Fe-S cluster biogenesis protein NfuA [Planctomycetota bacterium]|jgi:Fe-S cluster biogenesis protein NfuA|uniref:NifU family protein n=1 Tax=Patiriisocius sp. Uisw_047 TaxID=3230969 RepID=UPI0039E8880C
MESHNIIIQPTNNENIVKFVANSFLTQAKSYEFKNIEEAGESPIAQQLFHLPFVKTVYISQNFIAIEKYNIVSWDKVQEEVAVSISEYLDSEKVIVNESTDKKKVPVTVYGETTPNPAVLKFVANKPLVSGTFEFKNIDDAKHAPLAAALFNFPFVKEVFMSSNYVSVMKYDVAEWDEISMQLREFIRGYIEDGKKIFTDEMLSETLKEEQKAVESTTDKTAEKTYTDIDNEIMDILDEYVKPAVASDGGHIAFDSFDPETKTVKVILQGACSGCPSSTVTLKNGIQTMLKEMMQGRVQLVEAVNG